MRGGHAALAIFVCFYLPPSSHLFSCKWDIISPSLFPRSHRLPYSTSIISPPRPSYTSARGKTGNHGGRAFPLTSPRARTKGERKAASEWQGEEKRGARERECDEKKKEASVRVRQGEQQESFRCASKLMKRLLRCPQGLLIVKEGSIIPEVEI